MLCRKLWLVKTAISRRAMSGHHGGVAGENLPFRKCVGNPFRCAVVFSLYFGSGMWVPSIAFTYLMHKD